MKNDAHRIGQLLAGQIDEVVTNNNRKATGRVSHISSLGDAHIQAAIAYLAKTTGKTKKEIEDHLNDKVKEFEDIRKTSPILYDSIAANSHEQEIYKMLEQAKAAEPKGVAAFDPITFSALVRRVKAENPSIFPLRNFFNKKPLASPRLILTPSSDPKDAAFNKIPTAAATPNGEFIFNVRFMQQIMNFAFIKKTVPKSKKYASNGGPFPDEWSAVEFLIMHEFYHYTHGDFHYGKVMGGDPTIHNWASDFRSNYDLIKAGYDPLPIGLYNDGINYDKQTTYKEMYDIVEKEFKKLNKDQQKRVEDQLGDMGDDHSEHDSKDEPGTGGDQPSEEDLESHSKKVSKAAAEAEDDAEPSKAGDEGKPQPKADRGGPGGSPSSDPRTVDWTSIRPRFNWKDLLAKLVRSSDTIETTYQKVHRRNITSVHVATQTGAGVVRPGEKEVPANLVKLCIVIDSSGSMHEAIKTVLANVTKLLSDNASQIAKQFALVEFSSDYRIYSCTLSGKAGTATQIKGVDGMKTPGAGEKVDISVLLTRHAGGGTDFSPALVAELKGFIAQKYNVLILTDTDIIAGSNKENFMDLYSSHHSQVYLLLDSKNSFTSVVTTLKQASANISHL
jgi:predicted metal-dependent peptidase